MGRQLLGGVNTLNYLTRKAAAILAPDYEPEIMEMHHHHKKDAPSGTAERLMEIVRDAYAISEAETVHGRSGLVGAARQKNWVSTRYGVVILWGSIPCISAGRESGLN